MIRRSRSCLFKHAFRVSRATTAEISFGGEEPQKYISDVLVQEQEQEELTKGENVMGAAREGRCVSAASHPDLRREQTFTAAHGALIQFCM